MIYYFHSLDMPLFLMAIYAKNVQGDLSPQQLRALGKELDALKADWKGRKANEPCARSKFSGTDRIRGEIASEREAGVTG